VWPLCSLLNGSRETGSSTVMAFSLSHKHTYTPRRNSQKLAVNHSKNVSFFLSCLQCTFIAIGKWRSFGDAGLKKWHQFFRIKRTILIGNVIWKKKIFAKFNFKSALPFLLKNCFITKKVRDKISNVKSNVINVNIW
jgi:hypothetical protein